MISVLITSKGRAVRRKRGYVHLAAVVTIAAIAFVLLLVGGLTAVAQKQRELAARSSAVAARGSEAAVVKSFMTQWDVLQKTIPMQPVLGSTIWNVDDIQFIGNHALLASFEDGHVLAAAAYKYSPDNAFTYLAVFKDDFPFTEEAWRGAVQQYGDADSTAATYTKEVVRGTEVVRFDEWTKVPENKFVKAQPLVAVDTYTWQTYRNEQYGFEFKYPPNFQLQDWLTNVFQDVDLKKVNFHFGSEVIKNAPDADGACGSSSAELYAKQKLAFDKARAGNAFEEFGLTDSGLSASKVILNPQGVKFAVGITTCQGMADTFDLGVLNFVAVTFTKESIISFGAGLTGEESNNILVKDMYGAAKRLAVGELGGRAQQNYDDFLDVVSTFKLISPAASANQLWYQCTQDSDCEAVYALDDTCQNDCPSKAVNRNYFSAYNQERTRQIQQLPGLACPAYPPPPTSFCVRDYPPKCVAGICTIVGKITAQ